MVRGGCSRLRASRVCIERQIRLVVKALWRNVSFQINCREAFCKASYAGAVKIRRSPSQTSVNSCDLTGSPRAHQLLDIGP